MAMAMAISRRLLAAGRLPSSPTPPILLRRYSNVPNVAEAMAQLLEDLSSFLKSPRTDIGKATQLAEEMARVLKNEPPEIAMPKARGLEAELSKVLNVSSFETRLSQAEVDIKTYRKISFGVATLFGATLMAIPATVYIAKLDSDNQTMRLESRVKTLESGRDQMTPKTVNVDARVSHEFKMDSEPASK